MIGVCDMSVSRKLGLGAAAVALLASSVTPALARGGHGGWNHGSGWNSWGGGHHNGWRRHRRGGNDTGEILGGVLIGALLVGILSSASKRNRDPQRRADGDVYPQSYPQQDGQDDRNRGDIATEDQAVDACASAAESRAGRTASVREIEQTSRSSDGWDIEGIIEVRSDWRDRSADSRRFTCSVRYGAVDSVYVEDAKVAFAD